MTIDIKEVEKVAKLARLFLTEDEKQLYSKQLSRIIENFNELKAVPTEGVEVLSHALPVVNVLRDDEIEPSLGRELLMAGAPEKEGNFFRVPRIGD